MFIKNAEIIKVLPSDRYFMLKMSVDELFENNTPKVNFWTFCLVNNLLEKWEIEEGGDGNYYPMVSLVDLIPSEDEEKNKKAREFFKMLDISAAI